MTELKSESQSTRITQTQPGTKRQLAKPIADPLSASESNPESAASSDESTTDATSPKKRRTTKTEKAPTAKAASTKISASKRQATHKAANQAASTRVKLTWEASPSLEAVLAQFNEQLNATWIAIDELKSTVEHMQAQERTRSAHPAPPQPSSVRLPLEPAPVRAPQFTRRPPQTEIPPFRPTSGMNGIHPTRIRRRKPLYRLLQRCLKLPEQNAALAIDAAVWILAAAGLRIGLKYWVAAMPFLNIPVIVLMCIPALLAAYAAFFIPQANRIGIYRLLLVTLGLFVGGKL
ncbi:hypothetical protein H6F51_09995 [Cyanobacteria bacterium FACHB-DQ100]|nr:hypothetical protein [Cyanobacteria bacterium FACHB-DQ100]